MSRFRKVAFSLVAVCLAFGLTEGFLRLAGFHYQRVTTYLQFNYPRPGFLRAFFEMDPDLLYRIRPTVKQRGIDLTWEPRFDLKIRDPRRFGPLPAATMRIIALGDSSTYGVNTARPWPLRLEELLETRAGRGRIQVLNLGVPGYTAFQGRRVLETRGARLEPDLVIIYFGWNDHLLALGFTDAQQKVGGARVVRARNLLAQSRTYQSLSWLISRWPRQLEAEPVPRNETEPRRRVGQADFSGELRRMVRSSRQLGATPILCTYPTALSYLVNSGRPLPGWLIETHLGQGTPLQMLDLQRQYNDAVRSVAATTGTPLMDLENLFAARRKETLFAHPEGDMIHPGEAGYGLIAAALAQKIQALGWKKANPVAP